VTGLLRSELLKLRTTRLPAVVAAAVLVLVTLSTLALIGLNDDDLAAEDWPAGLADVAGIAPLFALLLAIVATTGEYVHGTIAPTFLAAPRRGRVLVAKAVVAGGAGVALALLAAVLAYAIGVPWLASRGVELDAAEIARNVVALLVAGAIWGAIGVGFGALLRSQPLAIVAALVWLFVAKPIVELLLDLADVPHVASYFPQASIGALVGSADVEDPLPRLLGGAVALAYVVGFAALAYWATTRRDVT
jgi:ABC-type transport system involved in multi-copper enzyme maturation permease subunit